MSMARIMNTYGERKITFSKGEGCYLWDDQGKRYLDALSGIAVCGLGHCHPEIAQALSDQAHKLIHTSNLFLSEPPQLLANLLCDVSEMDCVFFSNSGAEANEAAIKIARKYGNDKGITNPTIITMQGSFHGRTMATLTATGNPKIKVGFSPLLSGFIHVPYNDINAIKAVAEAHPEIVAVLVEPIQGEGGIQVPDDSYLREIRDLCSKNGWLMMLDEIQTGNCRTGKHFAYQHARIKPDVVTTAKGLGNGLPIGACLASGIAATILQPGNHGSTYGGNPFACHGSFITQQILLKTERSSHAEMIGNMLKKSLYEKLKKCSLLKEVRGVGLMIGIELTQSCSELVSAAAEKGLIINVTADKVVRLLPPLTISESQAETISTIVAEIILAKEQQGLDS